jgi:predicted Ser/Thr protein kinase
MTGSGLLDEIRSSLAPRYRVERELGQGGMGTVYLAHDTTRDQPVALKMLRPELTSVIGRERFVREVNITSTLEHPNLLQLIDKGEANDDLFYTMPFVDGPTLRQRLMASGPLPIDECIELGAQLADAIAYANERGIVHRDIKPENVLLANGRALLADFGIAQVLTPEETKKLTSSGITVGTAAYMSPEQVSRDRLDARSDQYSLACVIYEMVAGDPPFAAKEQRAVLARHALDPVPSLISIRPTVPPALERVIMRALSKQPADRWPSASAFATALRESMTAPLEEPLVTSQRRPLIVIAVAAVVIAVLFLAWRQLGGRGITLDDDVLAVLPLHVEGTPAPATSGDAMAEAIRTRLTGIGDWRIVAPPPGQNPRGRGVTMSEARRTARRLRAGTVLTGTVLSTPGGLAIDAVLTNVRDGRSLATIDRLTLPADQLLSGLDRVALTLMARAIHEPEHRVPGLAARKPEALKDYLTGVVRFQHGQYREAIAAFQKAMANDTTFAIAGLMAYWAGILGGDATGGAGYLKALRHPEQLSAADARVLWAEAGPRASRPSNYSEWLRAWSRVADSLPNSRDAPLRLSQMLREWGGATGNSAAPIQSANLLRGLLASDSGFAPALEGLLELGPLLSDTSEIRRIGEVYAARNPRADRRAYYQWRVAALTRNQNRSALTDSVLTTLRADELSSIIVHTQLDGGDLGDALSAVAELTRRARTPWESWNATRISRELAHNRGRVSDAPRWPSSSQFSVPIQPLLEVVQSLYWDGDSLAAARVVAERIPFADGPPPPPNAGDGRYLDVCTVGLWRAAAQDWARVRTAITRLAGAQGTDRGGGVMFIPVCRAILDAVTAGGSNPEAETLELRHLDSLAASAPPTIGYIMFAANVTVARLKEGRGDISGALAAVRRRSFATDFGAIGLSTYLREEGRLAALAGDTAGARTAYAKYLALRSNPEPRLEDEVRRVRSAFAALGPPARK